MKHCELCTGDSAIVKGRNGDGSPIYRTSRELCSEFNECTAEIDWEKVYGRD